jgi:hypothetical protein
MIQCSVTMTLGSFRLSGPRPYRDYCPIWIRELVGLSSYFITASGPNKQTLKPSLNPVQTK